MTTTQDSTHSRWNGVKWLTIDLPVRGCGRQERDVDLADPIRQPTHDIYWDDCQHQICDLPVWPLLLFRPVFWTHSSELTYDQKVEEKDEYKRYEKSQCECVECERLLAVHQIAFGPKYVTRYCARKLQCVGVHEDGHHQQGRHLEGTPHTVRIDSTHGSSPGMRNALMWIP